MYNLAEQFGARTVILLGEQEYCVMATGGKGMMVKDGWMFGANLEKCFREWVEGGIEAVVYKGAL